MPPKHSTQPSILKVCSACAATVERKNCHKNRYSEYICRRCQAAGTKFTHRAQRLYFARRRYLMKWALSVFLLCLTIACLVFVAIWMGILTFDSFSSFGSEHEALIDTRGGVSLNAQIKARLIEGSGQTALPPKTEKP